MDWRYALRQKRRETEKQLAVARRSVDNVVDSAGELSVVDNHPGDGATDVYDRGRQLGMVRQLEERLYEIDEAMKRLERGDFGYCDGCGQKIPAERLEVMPEARYCVECGEGEIDWSRPVEEEVLRHSELMRRDDRAGDTIRGVLERFGSSGEPGDGADDRL